MILLRELLKTSRLLTVLYDNLPESIKTSQLYESIANFLERYCRFNSISAESVTEIYTNYVTTYNKHCKQFIANSHYPTESGNTTLLITREEYDIVLIISVLFTPHRFRIMELLHEQHASGNALFIGLGPGLEMMLTKDHYTEIQGYDLSVNKFVFEEFQDVKLNTTLYKGQRTSYFDAIYLIEILEHLQDPYDLIDVCHSSLKKGGHIFLTTATDIPQFDHFYNFPFDHRGFEEKLQKKGFSVIYKEVLPHHYLTLDIKPYNHFYVIVKN